LESSDERADRDRRRGLLPAEIERDLGRSLQRR
jgi:hypothetical protein